MYQYLVMKNHFEVHIQNIQIFRMFLHEIIWKEQFLSLQYAPNLLPLL